MQVLFGPRRCEGVGLTDGEMMERLWSFMRRFSRMTKEMRQSHRTDVLCSALVYYGMQKKKKLGVCDLFKTSRGVLFLDVLANLLIQRMERALKIKAVSEETLQKLMPTSLES